MTGTDFQIILNGSNSFDDLSKLIEKYFHRVDLVFANKT